MEKIRNMSIRKTIIFYMLICLILSFLLSAVISQTARWTQERIWGNYAGQISGMEITRIPDQLMTTKDAAISQLCDFLQTWTILILSVGGSILTVFLLYRNKIKVPLEELEQGSRMISENELDFHVSYSNRDELGRLCAEFEKMRAQLEENSRGMWKMIEQEKSLRHAVAHDIRTPLSILKGNQEMLLDFIPQGILDEKQIIEMLETGRNQVERLEAFADTISHQTALEECEVSYHNTDVAALGKALDESARNIAAGNDIDIVVRWERGEQRITVDCFLVQETAENLISNAIRYAGMEIDVHLSVENNFLVLRVADDGNGFSENTEQLTRAYYHDNPKDELNHFGLGLYICRVYCEKHGGRLLLSNAEHGGACAAAYFALPEK